MDIQTFDALTRSLSAGGSRRRLLGLLATLPIGGGLRDVLTPADAAGKSRRKRGKSAKKRKHGKRGHAKKPKPKPSCTPHPVNETCAGQCGPVQNNCQQTVACPPCDCVPASLEQTCAGKCGETHNTCGETVDCGPCREGLTCDACAALGGPDLYHRATDCCGGGELVCDCGQLLRSNGVDIQCTRPGVCRPNHAPVALDRDSKLVWDPDGGEGAYPIELNAYEPDLEDRGNTKFRIVTYPEHGFLDANSDMIDGPQGPPALPAPPLPADVRMDCKPRCNQVQLMGCSEWCPDCTYELCPEGGYWNSLLFYIPNSSAFTGIDSFTYAAVDVFGAEGPPALYSITIYET